MLNTVVRLFAVTLLVSGCATQEKSVGLGGGIGLASGATLGAIADPGKNGELRTRNIIIGSALGGMAGLVTGSLIHSNAEKAKKEAFLQGQKTGAAPVSGAMPGLSTPKVETHWIEGKVQGNRYIEGHFEYVIIEPARWDVK
jgi:hypothetical protein